MTTPVPGTSGGRADPRQPLGKINHHLTWRPGIDRTDHDAAYWAPLLVVECEPCGWRRTLTDTYTTEQLARLDAMHSGQVTA